MRDLSQILAIKEKVNETVRAIHNEKGKLDESKETELCSAVVSPDF